MSVPNHLPFDEVNDAALSAYPPLLKTWFPNGRERGREFLIGNLAGDAGESLSINIDTGKWGEFAGGVFGGDPISLYAAAFCGGTGKANRTEACRQLMRDLGLPGADAQTAKVVPIRKKEDGWRSIVPPPSGVGVPNVRNATMKHTYLGPGGVVLRYVARHEPANAKKYFIPHTYGINEKGEKGWFEKHPNNPMCLYGLNRLAEKPDARKLLQEGELKTDQVQGKLSGWACLGWSGGSGRVADHDYKPLVSGGPVYVCGDSGADGKKAMIRAAEILHGLGASVFTVDTSEFPTGWDLGNAVTGTMTKNDATWKDAPWSGEKIEAFIRDNAKLYDPDPGNVDIDDVDLGEPTDTDSEWLKDPEEHATDTEGVLPLGHDNFIFYYLSRGTGQVHGLTPRQHGEDEQTALADPVLFWEKCGIFQKTDKEEWCPKKSKRWMMYWCRKRGIYNPDRVRGRGAWLDEDRDGNILAVMNVGNRLIVGGESLPLRLPGSRYFYEAALPLRYAVAPPLTKEQAGELAELCKLFSWDKPIYGILMAGWLAVAPICGALNWRPAIWLTGGSGSGKSTLEKLIIQPALGSIGLFVKGGTTEAGVRQKLGRDARPLWFDEAESENAKAKGIMQGILDLNRQSSSEGGAEIIKGTQNQSGAKTYHVKSCFGFSSINPMLEHLADESRLTVLELTGHNAEARAGFDDFVDRINRTMTPEFCAGFVARSVWLMPVILDNARTFAKAVAVHLGSSRVGDQIGTLLAGAFSEISDNRVSPEAARKWVEEQDWSDTTSADADPDERRLVNFLFQQHVTVKVGGSPYDRTIGDLILAANGGDLDTMTEKVASDVLLRHGIKFDAAAGGVWIANKHATLTDFLKDTPWAAGHHRALRRVTGAKDSGKAVWFGVGAVQRAVFVPVDLTC
jgi:putative DNA primase/helicase